MSKKKLAFTPKARLIQILGEHLIKDATVGILELAKNSYDADSTEVEILMSGLNTKKGKIVIRDNGSGMDENDFVDKWMNPASGHKQQQKETQKRTKLKRLPLGEKGVGRFAAQQIGNEMKMISKKLKSDIELHVKVDWSVFEDYKKNLNDIKVEYDLQQATIFEKEDSGTILEITKLKSDWKESEVKRIANSLKRMKSPFKGANDFNVTLRFENCPEEFTKYEGIETTDILDKAHYKLFGIVDKNGVLDFDYDVNIPGSNKIHKNSEIDLNNFSKVKILSKPSKCGGFFVYLHHYNKDLAGKSGFNKKDIEELCGVNVYRDGIRILPYGEKGNDWLELDKKRIQETKAIHNDTIIGMIEIDQKENVSLKDKTNREGLIENTAYEQFEELVKATVNILEKEKWISISEVKDKKQKPDIDINKSISDVKSKLNDVAKTVSMSTDDEISQAAGIIHNVGSEVEEIKKHIEQTVDDYEKVNKMLFNLAGTGLAAERFTHEFARLISGANASLGRLKKLIDLKVPKIQKETNIISGVLEALRNDIRLLGPMFYIKKVAREKELDLKEVIDNTLLLQNHFIERESIQVETKGESFNVFMREGSCMQIFNNLIDNSIFWLSRKSELDKRRIKIILDSKTSSVYISDSGTGVVSRYKDKIFDPFFSMKGEYGRGLGLYIVKEIMEEKNWNIFLLNKEDYPGLLKGATFKIAFTDGNE